MKNFSFSNDISKALRQEWFKVRAHLIDNITPGLQNGGQILQRKDTDSVPHPTPAPAVPFLKMVTGLGYISLLNHPLVIDHFQRRYPPQGLDHHLIWHGGGLAPFYKAGSYRMGQ